MNITINDLLKIIGEKEVSVLMLRAQLAEAQQRIAELEKAKPTDAPAQ